jgi:hypothetical protein
VTPTLKPFGCPSSNTTPTLNPFVCQSSNGTPVLKPVVCPISNTMLTLNPFVCPSSVGLSAEYSAYRADPDKLSQKSIPEFFLAEGIQLKILLHS